MSIGREDGIEIRGDVNMLTPNFRSMLGQIVEGGVIGSNGVNELIEVGYIELSVEKSGGYRNEYKLTPKGEAILRASDIFWEIVWKEFPNEEENRKTLLTPKNYHLLFALHSFKDGSTVDGLLAKLEGVVIENKRYDKSFVSSLLDGMQRKEILEHNKETGIWKITEFGEVILLASYEFYEQLLEHGFYENGTENRNEGGPISARDAFAEFDGGESWRERHSGAAE